MAQLGADVDELERLGRTFEREAARLVAARAQLDGALASTVWTGPDADGFRSRWRSTMATQLRAVDVSLREQSSVLQRQADEQRAASDAGGGGVRPVAFAGPTPQEPPGSPGPTAPPPATDDRGQTLDEILSRYQVADGTPVQWEPPWPESVFTDPVSVTEHEAEMLDDIGSFGRLDFKDIRDAAFDTADERFPDQGAEDGHNDAFRHTYWNALMTQRFGEQWAKDFATSHEQVPGNPADRESMDLYNNELGRRIATEHPDASPSELADLVERAVKDGDAVVIGADGNLAFSDQVELGHTGDADDGPAPGPQPHPDTDSDWSGGYDPGDGDGSESGTTTSGQ